MIQSLGGCHTCMVHCGSWAYLSSYVYHQPRPESLKSQNLPRSRPPGANTFPLRVKSLSKPQSKRYEPCLHTYQGRHTVHHSSLAYLLSYVYHQPRPGSLKSRNLPRSRPPAPIIDAVGGPVSVETSVQALRRLFTYLPRSPYGSFQ